MDASRNARADFSVTVRQIAVLYPACQCGRLGPLALMESADPRLISPVGFSPYSPCRLGGSRSDLCAITRCRPLRNLSATSSCMSLCESSFPFVDPRPYAGRLTKSAWYARSWASTAHTVRAVLFANATVTTFAGRRPAKRTAHSGGAFAWVSTARAP